MPVLTFENLIFVDCDKIGYIECTIAYWMWRIIPAFLVFVGFVGNILNITVLSRKQLRKKSTCVYLLFLAVSDTTILCSGPLVRILRIFLGIDILTLSAISCRLFIWLAYSSGNISCWLIVLVTVERTLLTLSPVNAKLKMTPRNALIASLALVLVTSLYTGHLLYGLDVTEIKTNTTQVNMTEVNVTQYERVKTCTQRPGEYTDFFNTAWGVIVTLTGSVVPLCFIVTGNAIVGISLTKRRRALRQHADRNTGNSSNRQSGNGFSTKIFFVLCVVYILTTVPYGAYFILLKYNEQVDDHTFAKYQLINIVMRSLLWSNFSFNFLLYFMTGSLFRNEFQKMFKGACKKCMKERM